MNFTRIQQTLFKQGQRLAALPRAVWLFGSALILALLWYIQDRHLLNVQEEVRERPAPKRAPVSIPLRAQLGETPLQLTSDGTGPLFHRRYRADIRQPERSAEAMMEHIKFNLNEYSPTEMARFEKTKGSEAAMEVGDEYLVHIMGPWDGPVRVVDVTPTSFSLVTMEGHMEAGEIRFRFQEHPTPDVAMRFEIASWARSRDMLVDLGYNKLKVLKQGQTSVWAYFCEQVAKKSGGELVGEIDVLTEKAPFRGEVIPNE